MELDLLQVSQSLQEIQAELAVANATLDILLSAYGLIEVDDAGRIMRMNARAQEITGYTQQELRLKRIEELVPGEWKVPHFRFVSAYMLDPQPRPMTQVQDLVLLRKDGQLVPVEIALIPAKEVDGTHVRAAISVKKGLAP